MTKFSEASISKKAGSFIYVILRYTAAIVFITICINLPALGQMSYTTVYSDAWGDETYIYGCGVTEDYYNSWGHTFNAITTITSPQGRTSTQDSGYNTPYGRADVVLEFQDNDSGTYLVNTEHYYYCPVVFETYYAGASTASMTGSVHEVYYGFRYSVPNPYSNGTICNYQKCDVAPCGSVVGQDWVPQGQSCPAGYKDTFRKIVFCFHRDHVHLPTFNPCP